MKIRECMPMRPRAILLCSLAILAAMLVGRAVYAAEERAAPSPFPFPQDAWPNPPKAPPQAPSFGLDGPHPPAVDEAKPPRKAATPNKKLDDRTRAARAEALKKAMSPRPSIASLREQALASLFKRLAAAPDQEEARPVVLAITQIWSHSQSDTADLLMERATAAIVAHQYPLALSLLDKIITIEPTWAEAWNKRATVRYLGDDMEGSVADIEQVLKIEPRHFGALAGLGLILQKEGLNKSALAAFRKALAIFPQQPELHTVVDKLTLEVEGRDI
jgi:Flp pilus assembly protein TadD